MLEGPSHPDSTNLPTVPGCFAALAATDGPAPPSQASAPDSTDTCLFLLSVLGSSGDVRT